MSKTEKFIKDAIKQHAGCYDYNKVVYTTSNSKVEIICQTHGSFWQLARSHLSGHGCSKCGATKVAIDNTSNCTLFIEKAKSIHGDVYSYNNTTYLGSMIKLEIECRIHGIFWQIPNSHLSGHGCPTCGRIKSTQRFLKEPTLLYYIKFYPKGVEPVWKIGITLERVGIYTRFKSNKIGYEVLSTQVFRTGEIAYMFEQYLLNKHKEFQYTGPPVLQGGNSELFTKDILNEQNAFTSRHKNLCI